MQEQESRTYTARWIFPVDQEALPQGILRVQGGEIVAVQPRGTLHADVDFGNAAILPGFVNAHTHLDLTGLRGMCPPTPDFTQWLRAVIGFRRTRSAEEVQADIARGLQECLAGGTTLLGDISSGGASWAPLAHTSCRAVVFYELLGLPKERAARSWQAFCDWSKQRGDTETCIRGASPHAPYSVHRTLFEHCAQESIPVATHLAETAAELELLRRHSGPFVAFLEEMNVWDPAGLIADPLVAMRLLPRGLFVHGNYLAEETPFTPDQTLVICPRTHAAFGHSPHPLLHLVRRGVRIALGTDSLASNPDLEILAEARCLRERYSNVSPSAILRMVTLNGAEALGFGGRTGSLTAGKSADFVVLPLPDEDPADAHDLVLRSGLRVSRVMFRGRWVFAEGAAS